MVFERLSQRVTCPNHGEVSSCTWFRKSGFFFVVRGPCFTAIEEDGGDKRLVQLELACKADGVAPPDGHRQWLQSPANGHTNPKLGLLAT